MEVNSAKKKSTTLMRTPGRLDASAALRMATTKLNDIYLEGLEDKPCTS